MDRRTNIHFNINFDYNGSGVGEAQQQISELFRMVNRSQAATRTAAQGMTDFAVKAGGVVTALTRVDDAMTSLTSAYQSFNTAMRKVNTMAELSEEGFNQIKKSVDGLARSVPLAREQLADGLYQVISNGVPKDNWIEFLNVSARSAVGGIADLGQTVTVTSTIIKNYALGWESAQEIQDKIQLTAKNGVTSFEQLAAALPRVTGNAASLGVSIDELMASFATLTGVSGNTAEVSTQLAAIFSSLVKPSSEAAKMAAAMGIQFDAAAIQAKGGFESFLSSLQSTVSAYAAATGELEQEIYGKLFGSAEALRALGALTGPLADKFRENIGAMTDSAGTMDLAFEQMDRTVEASMQKMKSYMASAMDGVASAISEVQPYFASLASLAMLPQGISVLCGAFVGLGNAIAGCGKSIMQSTLVMKAWGAAQAYCRASFPGLTTAIYGQARAWGVSTAASRAAAIGIKAFAVAAKTALISTGIGAAIWAVGEAMAYVVGKLNEADEAQEAYNEKLRESQRAQREMESTVADARVAIEGHIKAIEGMTDGTAEATAEVAALNKTYGNVFGSYETLSEWYDVLKKKSQTYIKQIKLEAEAQYYKSKVTGYYSEQAGYDDTIARYKSSGLGEKWGRVMKESGGFVDRALKKLTDEEQALQKAVWAAYEKQGNKPQEIVDAENKLSEIVAEQAKVAAELSVPKKALEIDVTGSGKGDGSKATLQIPEGSLKAIQKEISAVKGRLELAIDDESRIALNAELKALESRERAITFRYKFPELTSGNLNELGDRINAAAQGVGSLKVPMGLTSAPAIPESVKAAEPIDPVSPDALARVESMSGGLNNLGAALRSVSGIASENGQAWLSWGASVLGAVAQALPAMAQLIPALTAKAGAEAMSENSAAGPWGWIAGLSAMAAVVAAMASLPKFAEGGIAYGPTVGLFGEYAGAANNPEVVAPLDKLRTLIEPRAAGGNFTFRLHGRVLKATLDNESRYSSKR